MHHEMLLHLILNFFNGPLVWIINDNLLNLSHHCSYLFVLYGLTSADKTLLNGYRYLVVIISFRFAITLYYIH